MILIRKSKDNKDMIRRRVRHTMQNNSEKKETNNKQKKTESEHKN